MLLNISLQKFQVTSYNYSSGIGTGTTTTTLPPQTWLSLRALFEDCKEHTDIRIQTSASKVTVAVFFRYQCFLASIILTPSTLSLSTMNFL